MAAVAPREAKSFFALTLLVTRGSPLLPAATPVLIRLLPPARNGPPVTPMGFAPLTVDCLRGPAVLVGLIMEGLRTGTPFLKLVVGGSGRGRLLADGVAVVLWRLIGESFLAGIRGGGIDDLGGILNFWPVIKW